MELDASELSRLTGIRILGIRAEAISSGGAHSRVFACESEIGDLVLRICKGQQGFYTQYFPDKVNFGNWFDQRWVIEAVRSLGVPAPEIIWSDRDRRWVVMRRLPGIPIHDEYEDWNHCPYDEAHFGRILRLVHSIHCGGYGPIDDFGAAIFSTWQGFLMNGAESAIETSVARGALPSRVADRLRKRWLPRLETAYLDRPSLLHMESLGFANILYQPDTRAVTGLIDYEDCIGGDPLFEVAWMRFYFEHHSHNQTYFDFTRFTSGYGEIDWVSDRLELYSPFPPLDKLRWIEPFSDRARGYVRWLDGIVTGWRD